MAEEPAKRVKRKVKNPETFRERAIKASADSEKPARSSRLKSAGGKVVGPVFRPIGKGAQKVGNIKPVKAARKPLRFVGLVLFPRYFRESWKELRKVTWPTMKQSRSLTYAVLIFAIIFGALVAVVDYGLDKLFRTILLK